MLILVDSTTNAGRSFHGEKNLFTKHAFLALTRADCLKSLNLWPLGTELHRNSYDSLKLHTAITLRQ